MKSTRPSYESLPDFTGFNFSETYPQLVEFRLAQYEVFVDDRISRIALNSKMVSLFTSDYELEAFSSLQLGMKDVFRFVEQDEWIEYLKNCLENYRVWLREGFKSKYDELSVQTVKLSFPTGKVYKYFFSLVASFSMCFSHSKQK